MTGPLSPIIFLSGAGGGAPDLQTFRAGAEDMTCFEVIGYPGWKRFLVDGFSADVLIADLWSRSQQEYQRARSALLAFRLADISVTQPRFACSQRGVK